MTMVVDTKKAMGERPVVVVVETGRPIVLSEIEPFADAILISFNVQHQALLDIICGNHEPSALLPMQMPADMKAVEEQQEDVPRDMRCYRDSDGNTYDFAFGLNWKGIINDERVKKYK
jgi:beta-glucosidase